jgi:very-short-patch-repair endonuclease
LEFYCPDRELAAPQDYDQRRTTFLFRRGIRVLRFPTDLVFREPTDVLDAIVLALGGGPSP